LNNCPSNEQGEPSWEKVEQFAVYGKDIWYFGDKNMLIRRTGDKRQWLGVSERDLTGPASKVI
jgi:uncharacterized protein YneR